MNKQLDKKWKEFADKRIESFKDIIEKILSKKNNIVEIHTKYVADMHNYYVKFKFSEQLSYSQKKSFEKKFYENIKPIYENFLKRSFINYNDMSHIVQMFYYFVGIFEFKPSKQFIISFNSHKEKCWNAIAFDEMQQFMPKLEHKKK